MALRAFLGVLFLNGVIGKSCTQACPGNISTAYPLAPSFSCPVYTTTISPGASTINDCLCIPGSAGANGAVQCALCLPGSFSSTPGSTSCTLCPNGVGNPNDFGATNDSICIAPQTFVTITLFVNGTLSVNEQGNLRVQIADSLNISVDLIKLEQVPARRRRLLQSGGNQRRLLQSGGSQIIITITVPPPIPGTNTSTTGNTSTIGNPSTIGNALPSAALISSQIQNSVSLSVVQSWFTAIGLPANLVSAIAVEVVLERIVSTTTTPMLLANTTTPVPSLPASTPLPVESTDEPNTSLIWILISIGGLLFVVFVSWLANYIYNNRHALQGMRVGSEYVPIKTRDPMERVCLQMRHNGARNHV